MDFIKFMQKVASGTASLSKGEGEDIKAASKRWDPDSGEPLPDNVETVNPTGIMQHRDSLMAEVAALNAFIAACKNIS